MVTVNTSGYGTVLSAFILNPVNGLYTSNASVPLQAQAGLREFYAFGLYSYCAYVDGSKPGVCSDHTSGQRFTPYDVMTADMFSNYSLISTSFIPDNSFRDSKYLGDSSKAGYAMILLGTIATVLSMLAGITKKRVAFLTAACSSSFAALTLLIGASIWSASINKSQSINSVRLDFPNSNTQVAIGIIVSAGSGLYIVWAAFVLMFCSVLPYMINFHTFRG